MPKPLALALALLLAPLAAAQPADVRPGGRAAPGTALTAAGEAAPAAVFGLADAGGRPTVAYRPTAEDRWAAMWTADAPGGPITAFAYDGYLYTTGRTRTNLRQRRFPTDVTAETASNAYHVAL